MTIPEKWLEQKPANYTTYQGHLQHIQEMKEKREAEILQREINREQRKLDRKERQKNARIKAQEYKMDVSAANFSFGSQGQGEGHTQGQVKGQTQNETMEAQSAENGS